MLNALFDFFIGLWLGRAARNTALAAERAAWTENMKAKYQNALAEREAAQQALRDRQRPLLYVLLAILAVIVVLAMLFGGQP
jgi:hypothetical protein